MKRLISIAIFLFLLSCGGRKDELDEKFVQAYAEILIAGERFKNDSLKLKSEISSILSRYRISRAEMDSIAREYNREPERWAKFYNSVRKYLEKKFRNVK
jgi:SUMO ligase MMS21 Smc5/6 complex component